MFNLLIWRGSAIFTICGLFLSAFTNTPIQAEPIQDDRPTPRLIKVGWDGGGPQKMLDNLERVRELPFDGHTFKLGMRLQNAFWKEPIPRAEFQAHFDAMEELMRQDLGNAQHNLVMIWCTGEAGWDWFNDDHWDAALHNMRMLTELASLGKSDIFFDPESYPKLTHAFGEDAFWVFNYQDQPYKEQYGYDDYRKVIFERGVSYMRMLQEVDPDLDILSMYGFGKFNDLLDTPGTANLFQKIKDSTYYNLLPAFYAGMLSIAHEGFEIFDGNEPAYYYTTAEEFYRDTHQLMTLGYRLLPEGLKHEFREHYRMSHAIYASDLYAMDPNATDQYRSFFVQEMTRDQQAEILAHNVYYSLKTSDRYAWFYTENDIDVMTGEIPSGMLEAIDKAKQYLEEGRVFPNAIEKVVADARLAYEKKAAGMLKRGKAISTIAVSPPIIDGLLNDTAWKGATPHFLQITLQRDEAGYVLEEPTTVSFTHDGDALYVLINGELKQPGKLKSEGDGRDGDVWRGDDIEIAISDPTEVSGSKQFYLLMVNPAGTRYDALVTPDAEGGEHLFDTGGYSPTWDVAMTFPDGRWVTEVAIPWSEIGGKPRSDQDLRINVLRSYTNQPGISYASFSQTNDGFLNQDEFGMVVLE